MKIQILLLMILLSPQVLSASSSTKPSVNEQDRLIDSLNTYVTEGDTPGLQYALVSSDGVIFEFASGFADISAGRAVTADSMFNTYSLTKTFTAAGVLRLVDQRKISLDDPVTKYLPDLPYGNELKIKHLLSQTSGIPNPVPLRWVHLAAEHDQFNEDEELTRIVAEHPKLRFEPGEKYGYSNISYWLLGKVIEKVSGESYSKFMSDEIFAKIGASNNVSFDIPTSTRSVKGYIPKWSWMNILKYFVSDSSYWGNYEGGWLHINDHYLNGPAFGGLVASARGIAAFLQDLLSESSKILSPEMKSQFLEQQKNNSGENIEMSLGWHVDTLDGTPYLFKQGGGMGFHAEMRIYPAKGFGSVLLINNGTFNSRKSLSHIDRVVLGTK